MFPFESYRGTSAEQTPTPQYRDLPPLFPVRPPAPPQNSVSSRGISGLFSGLLASGQSGGRTLNLPAMLDNTQKAVQTAQMILPMVEQFGPMLKNAPALLKALNKVQEKKKEETDDHANGADKKEAAHPDSEERPPIKKDAKSATAKTAVTQNRTPVHKPSLPKLYI
ncbi:MAG: YqfQ family protein [Sporolactobacillus sp.]|jgi:hypothetical protein|nr:YqfQ family protein [Sporolactobacillus sp.]